MTMFFIQKPNPVSCVAGLSTKPFIAVAIERYVHVCIVPCCQCWACSHLSSKVICSIHIYTPCCCILCHGSQGNDLLSLLVFCSSFCTTGNINERKICQIRSFDELKFDEKQEIH